MDSGAWQQCSKQQCQQSQLRRFPPFFHVDPMFPSYPQDSHYEAVENGNMLDISDNNWPNNNFGFQGADFLTHIQENFQRISGKLQPVSNGAVISFAEQAGKPCFVCNETNLPHAKHFVSGHLTIVDGMYRLEITFSSRSDVVCQTEPQHRRKPVTSKKKTKIVEEKPLEPVPLAETKQLEKPEAKEEPVETPEKPTSIAKKKTMPTVQRSTSPIKKKKQENLEKNIKKLENHKKTLIRKFMNRDKDKENLRKCDKCPLAFVSEEKLERHVEAVHLGFRPHMCKICGKSFHLKKILKQHLVAHQRSKPHVCKICGASFTRLNRLKEHAFVHSGIRPFDCPFCGKGFIRKMYLMNHMRHHTGERPYKCGECGKSFIEQSNLLAHKKLHKPSRLFTCKHCNESFNLKKLLDEHMETHQGALERQCEICGKRFATENMKRHLLTHSQVFDFDCPTCGKQFKRKDKLNQHLKTHTSHEKDFKCEECGRSFLRADQLKEHLRQHEDPNLAQCPICLKFFTKSEKFDKHVQNHSKEKKPLPSDPEPCTICGKTLSNRASFRVHMEKVHSVRDGRERKPRKVKEKAPCSRVEPPQQPFEIPIAPMNDEDYSNYIPVSNPSPQVEVPLADIQASFNYTPGLDPDVNFGLNQDFCVGNSEGDNVGFDDGNTSPSQIDPSVNLTPEAFSAVAYLLAFPSYQF